MVGAGRKKLKQVDWIHPSCRDLVIEELVSDPTLHFGFLQTMSLEGIKLAISEAGGSTGERSLPLMTSPKSWELLGIRCVALASESETGDVADLLEVLTSSASDAKHKGALAQLTRIISSVCDAARTRWDGSGIALNAEEFSAYCKATVHASPLAPLPRLGPSWEEAVRKFRSELDEAEAQHFLDSTWTNDWVRLAATIRDNEPRFLRQVGFPQRYAGDVSRFIELAERDTESVPILDSSEDLLGEAGRLTNIGEVLNKLSPLLSTGRIRSRKVARRLNVVSDRLNERALEEQEPEPDYDDYSEGYRSDTFDVEGLFSDL